MSISSESLRWVMLMSTDENIPFVVSLDSDSLSLACENRLPGNICISCSRTLGRSGGLNVFFQFSRVMVVSPSSVFFGLLAYSTVNRRQLSVSFGFSIISLLSLMMVFPITHGFPASSGRESTLQSCRHTRPGVRTVSARYVRYDCWK